jgi:aquaporin Z
VVTTPGEYGPGIAFTAELVISFIMMSVVLMINTSQWKRWTGVVAGCLVALYIAAEAPLSGMSMNPARTFASALVAGNYTSLWVYFVAPPLGMLIAALTYKATLRQPRGCAKIYHCPRMRCIFCGYVPSL